MLQTFDESAARAQADPARAAAASQRPMNPRLLLIDDDPLLLKSLRDTLEADGHVIVTANDGGAGIEAFRAACDRGETFAAVITDLGMPNIDGRRVATAIHRNGISQASASRTVSRKPSFGVISLRVASGASL